MITITEEKDTVYLISSPSEITKVRTWLISHEVKVV
ncbi:hypothetical protein [Haladaptatus pallidirubidus]